MVYKDYYKILGLNNNASGIEIKKAYRILAMKYHPDHNQGNEEWANEKFKEINEAFSVLGDQETRKQYHQFGTEGNIGDIFSRQTTRTTFEDLMNDFDGASLGFDFLDSIFSDLIRGTGFAFRSFRHGFVGQVSEKSEIPRSINLEEIFGQAQCPHGKDICYEVIISGMQATIGVEKELIRKGKKLRVKIPTGVKTGSKVRLRNAQRITDGESGDIIITVRVI